MLIVIALGGKALVAPEDPIVNARAIVRLAARALAPVAAEHQLVILYGDGPQAGVLALESAAYAKAETCPIDVRRAQAEAIVAYLLEQELRSLLPDERTFATLLTTVEVRPGDPAFKNPRMFVGPLYLSEEAERLAAERRWTFKADGDKWRRVVACPEPSRIVELRAIESLIERNTIVIAAGGGGIPLVHERSVGAPPAGAECLVDKDSVAELLARQLGADLFVMLTDADAVYVNWETSARQAICRAAPAALGALSFAAESMGRKVDAACRFAQATGNRACIGSVSNLGRILAGEAGTSVSVAEAELLYETSGDAVRNVMEA